MIRRQEKKKKKKKNCGEKKTLDTSPSSSSRFRLRSSLRGGGIDRRRPGTRSASLLHVPPPRKELASSRTGTKLRCIPLDGRLSCGAPFRRRQMSPPVGKGQRLCKSQAFSTLALSSKTTMNVKPGARWVHNPTHPTAVCVSVCYSEV